MYVATLSMFDLSDSKWEDKKSKQNSNFLKKIQRFPLFSCRVCSVPPNFGVTWRCQHGSPPSVVHLPCHWREYVALRRCPSSLPRRGICTCHMWRSFAQNNTRSIYQISVPIDAHTRCIWYNWSNGHSAKCISFVLWVCQTDGSQVDVIGCMHDFSYPA